MMSTDHFNFGIYEYILLKPNNVPITSINIETHTNYENLENV